MVARIPSTDARTSIGIWQDYNASLISRELSFASGLFGFTSVRVMLNALVYSLDAPRFLQHYEHFLASCAAHNLTAMPVLFDADFPNCDTPGCANPDKDFITQKRYINSSWCPSPGAKVVDDATKWSRLEPFVEAVAGGRYANDGRIAALEMMNEPRESSASPFLAHFAAFVGKISSRLIAVEPQYTPPPKAALDAASVLSYHTYWCTFGCMNSTYTHLAAAAAQHDRTAVNVELGGRPPQGGQPYCDAIQGVLAACVGYYAWELMLGRDQFDTGTPRFQGLVWPNGSVYDANEADCIRRANA